MTATVGLKYVQVLVVYVLVRYEYCTITSTQYLTQYSVETQYTCTVYTGTSSICFPINTDIPVVYDVRVLK